LFDSSLIWNVLKREDALRSERFKFALEFVVKKSRKPAGTETEWAHQLLAYADNVNLLGE
jgi:hypothetical protein